MATVVVDDSRIQADSQPKYKVAWSEGRRPLCAVLHSSNKKRSETTKTLRAGCSKAGQQTNTQTDRGDYSTLRSLARSVMN